VHRMIVKRFDQLIGVNMSCKACHFVSTAVILVIGRVSGRSCFGTNLS
jgi:hypothetical protein